MGPGNSKWALEGPFGPFGTLAKRGQKQGAQKPVILGQKGVFLGHFGSFWAIWAIWGRNPPLNTYRMGPFGQNGLFGKKGHFDPFCHMAKMGHLTGGFKGFLGVKWPK